MRKLHYYCTVSHHRWPTKTSLFSNNWRTFDWLPVFFFWSYWLPGFSWTRLPRCNVRDWMGAWAFQPVSADAKRVPEPGSTHTAKINVSHGPDWSGAGGTQAVREKSMSICEVQATNRHLLRPDSAHIGNQSGVSCLAGQSLFRVRCSLGCYRNQSRPFHR
jgi:hypothetical protein